MRQISLLLFIVFGFVISVWSQTASEMIPLSFGETIEKELTPQKHHSYKIRLEAGQYAKFEATQKGCDVVFMLVASDGTNLIDIRNDVQNEGVETTWVGISKTDDYELRVISFGRATGKYSLKFSELRPATQKEIDFTSGHQIFNQAFNLNTLYVEAETLQKAIFKYEEAAEKFKAAEAHSDYSTTLGNISNVYRRLGNRLKSLEYAQKRVEYSRQLQDKFGEANGLNTLGAAYLSLGKWQEALETLSESLVLRRETKNKRGEATTLSNIGQFYDMTGDLERSEGYQIQALQLFREIEDVSGQAVSLNNTGRNAFDRGDFARALQNFQEAVRLGETLRNQQYQTAYLNNLGKGYFAVGDVSKSLETLNIALVQTQKTQDKVNEAATLRNLGNIYLSQEKLTEAEASLDKSLQIYRQIEDPLYLAETLFSLAKVKRKLGKLEESQKYLEEALKLIESFRSSIRLNELRDSLSNQLNDYYSFYTELLMQRGSQESNNSFEKQAWLASERGRARNLLNLLNESNANIYEGVDKNLLAQEKELYSLLNARLENLTRVLSGRNTAKQVEILRTEVEKIRSDYQIVQSKIRENNPRYASLTQPQPVSIEELQNQVLDAKTALLSYTLGAEKSFLWLITKDNRQVFELPKRAVIETKARENYELLTARNRRIKFETADEKRNRIAKADSDLEKVSGELSRILLSRIENLIGDKRLFIVADGSLQYIPFAALKLKNRYLVETNEIVNLPSASALSVLRRETLTRKSAPKTIAVLADPVFDVRDERFTFARIKSASPKNTMATRNVEDLTRSIRDFENEELSILRLPFTRKEAQSISKFVPNQQRKVALDFAATRQLALSEEMNQYRIIHFATHGLLNNKNPELSGLVFSLIDDNGNPLNGFLRTDEVFNMKLSADLVVLSGCKTGLGKEIRGEGLIGLTRGFMYAGASRTMVSLWDVNDEATAELMGLFYQNLLGKKIKPAQALREAQLAFLKDKRFANPYFAMAFTIHGEF